MKTIGKVKYVGVSFGVDSLTDGTIYDVLEVDDPFIRIIDDSEEPYYYSIYKPSSMENFEKENGRWELVESYDDKLTSFFK